VLFRSMEGRCDRCGKPGQGPFDRFHVGGRVWVGWDCMSVEEQRRERMVCERCEAPYHAEDDPDEGHRGQHGGFVLRTSRARDHRPNTEFVLVRGTAYGPLQSRRAIRVGPT
jgi:hypothetical protein